MSSHKLRPSERLLPFVDYVRVSQPGRVSTDDDTDASYRRLPDGQVELILRVHGEGGALHVVGTRTEALVKSTLAATEFVTVRFKAGGAYPFFGLPLSELTNQLAPLETLWCDAAGVSVKEALQRDLLGAASSAERVSAVERALVMRLSRQPYEPSSVPTVRRAVRLLRDVATLPTVDALALQLGSSSRQLRRAFADVVGVAPKQYLRVLRFQRALQTARRSPTASWSTIASLAGYFDQAHLNAEFQALAGSTPGALCPRARPARAGL